MSEIEEDNTDITMISIEQFREIFIVILLILICIMAGISYCLCRSILHYKGGTCDATKRTEPLKEPSKYQSFAVMCFDNDTNSFMFTNTIDKTVLTQNTKFRIGSITKLLTACTVLHMHDKKLLDINKTVTEYVSDQMEFKDPRINKITIAQCLTHSSGLPWSLPKNVDYTEAVPIKIDGDLAFNPGESIQYSNVGYQIITLILQKITGLKWYEAIDKYVCAPLELKNTNTSGTDIPAYDIYKGSPTIISNDNELVEAAASGGFYSSCNDLLKFIYKWDTILSSESQSIFEKCFDKVSKRIKDLVDEEKQLFKSGNIGGCSAHIIIPKLKYRTDVGGEIMLSNVSRGILEWYESRNKKE